MVPLQKSDWTLKQRRRESKSLDCSAGIRTDKTVGRSRAGIIERKFCKFGWCRSCDGVELDFEKLHTHTHTHTNRKMTCQVRNMTGQVRNISVRVWQGLSEHLLSSALLLTAKASHWPEQFYTRGLVKGDRNLTSL